MAALKNFDSEIERIGGVLTATRDALGPACILLAETARGLILPDEESLAEEAERLAAEMPERQTIEAAMARLVADLATEIDVSAREFDNRDLPTRLETLIGYMSRAAKHRRQQARWRSPAPLNRLAELLRRADRLAGLVKSERDFLIGRRRESEGDLVTLIDHRPEIVEKLRGEDGTAMTGLDVVGHTEPAIKVFQDLVAGLNARVGTCNILLHKLITDTENLLILYRMVADASRQGDAGLKPELFPHLAPEVERFSNGMLTLHGLDRRRYRADQAFAERFPAEAAGEAADAGGRAGGFRLPTIFGFKVIRSR
ncbi:hypothetical protein J2857_000959 [Neorhizobium galegae]|uniref:hypothetical protein n=1 Tax=Neorhizobium galegae TaxID=399 RepID=UPI001AE7EC4D|nr:hypothetical protein [Neorhizobium galegae]MBP2558208.1 hypothetical protein [Neorhizobium galegae]